MSEFNCPYCKEIVSEEAKFCYKCASQLRCRNCGTYLIANANACHECGEPVGSQSQNGSVDFNTSSVPSGYNRLRIRSTPNSYDVDLLCTDNAVEHVNDLLAHLGDNHFTRQNVQGDNAATQSRMHTIVEIPPQSIAAPAQDAQAEQPSIDSYSHSQRNPPADSGENGIWRIFCDIDGKPVLDEIKLKAGTTKRNYVEHLVVLYLYARVQLGEDKVPRSDLYAVLDDANVRDSNTATYLKDHTDFRQIDNDCFRLTAGGRDRAKQFIADALNPEIPDGYYPGAEGHTRGVRKASSKSGEHSTSSDDIASWAEDTRSLRESIDHTAFAGWNTRNKALLGLYGIRMACGPEQEVSAVQIAAYLNRAFELAVPSDNIRRELQRVSSGNDNLVIRGDHGVFRITSSGAKVAEALLAGKDNT